MDRVKIITHRDREIIFGDFSHTSTFEEHQAILAQLRQLVSTRPPGTALTLLDYTGIRFNLESVEAQKKYSAEISPYVKASAVTGLNTVMSLVLRGVVRITGRNIRLFQQPEAAKDWLAEQG